MNNRLFVFLGIICLFATGCIVTNSEAEVIDIPEEYEYLTETTAIPEEVTPTTIAEVLNTCEVTSQNTIIYTVTNTSTSTAKITPTIILVDNQGLEMPLVIGTTFDFLPAGKVGYREMPLAQAAIECFIQGEKYDTSAVGDPLLVSQLECSVVEGTEEVEVEIRNSEIFPEDRFYDLRYGVNNANNEQIDVRAVQMDILAEEIVSVKSRSKAIWEPNMTCEVLAVEKL